MNPQADYVFEVSWEICNKVGGIYTVIKSKASTMMEYYKNYILIGPYFEKNARIDFVQMDPPAELSNAFQSLKSEGITCYFGKWLEVKGRPLTILVDFNGIIWKKNTLKKNYWDDYHIDSLRGYWDFEEPMLWSHSVGMLLEKIRQSLGDSRIVGHFHEWLSAFALLYLKKNCPDIATVFTAHATTLGRAMAGNGADIYGLLDSVDPLHEAYQTNIEAKFLAEKAAALNADAFTTVSQITGIEAEKFLGRKPDILVLNGLDIDKFPTFEEISVNHISSRDKIREFLSYYFFPYYTFDLNHNLIFFTLGRFEYRNKGFDLLIKALAKLNSLLKKINDGKNPEGQKTISVLLWIPMAHHGIRLDVLENKNYYGHITDYVESHSDQILSKIVYDFISKKQNIPESFFTEVFLREITKDIVSFARKGDPPLSTHNVDESTNPVIIALKAGGLLNRKEDIVKVILEPVYLDGSDGLIDLNLYDAVQGCHLGLFPSYYEPWGYTPLESAALGVPSLTTDLAGFGMFIKSNNVENKGIFILDRFHRSDDEIIDDFARMMMQFYNMNHSERISFKLDAKKLSSLADWKFLVDNYIKAHNHALSNNSKRGDAALIPAK